MKNYSSLLLKSLKGILVVAFISVSCTSFSYQNVIHGNGNVTTEDRHASSFNTIKATEGIEVIISKGNEESIRVEADENFIQYIKTDIKENQLKVHVQDGVQLKGGTKKVYVSYTYLNTIKASSGGMLKATERLESDRLQLSTSSGGHLKLDISAEELNAHTSSGGIMKVSGNTGSLDISASSGGILTADDLDGTYCKADASSGGIMEIGEFNKLRVHASSGGVLKYSGNPSEKDFSKSSGGVVSRR